MKELFTVLELNLILGETLHQVSDILRGQGWEADSHKEAWGNNRVSIIWRKNHIKVTTIFDSQKNECLIVESRQDFTC